jgi:hypothetical protein
MTKKPTNYMNADIFIKKNFKLTIFYGCNQVIYWKKCQNMEFFQLLVIFSFSS